MYAINFDQLVSSLIMLGLVILNLESDFRYRVECFLLAFLPINIYTEQQFQYRHISIFIFSLAVSMCQFLMAKRITVISYYCLQDCVSIRKGQQNTRSLFIRYTSLGPLHEKRLNTILYIPVYGLRMPIYGNNLSQYGKIQDRIQAFFAQWSVLELLSIFRN